MFAQVAHCGVGGVCAGVRLFRLQHEPLHPNVIFHTDICESQHGDRGGQGFTITANGSGFTTGALILWNGTALTTTLVSSAQLTAPVPASNLATAGTVQVAVQIPGSAQSATQNVYNTTTTEISNVVLFTINTAPGRHRRSLRFRRRQLQPPPRLIAVLRVSL